MKFKLLLLLGLVTVSAIGQGLRIQEYPYWSGGSTNSATALSWVIVPSKSSLSGGTPVITSIAAYSDKLTGKVQVYRVAETATVTYTNTTVSIPINSTNTGTKWDTGTIVIKHALTETYEKRTLTTSGGDTNLQVTAATLETCVPGDTICKVTTAGAATFNLVTNTVGANLMNFVASGEALVTGQPGCPMLIEVDATGSVANMACVTAKFVRQTP